LKHGIGVPKEISSGITDLLVESHGNAIPLEILGK